MSVRTDTFDLGPLHLRAGEARHLDLEIPLGPFELSNERYDVSAVPGPGRARRLAHDRRRLVAAPAADRVAERPVHALPGARVAVLRGRRPRGRPARRRPGAGLALRRRRGRRRRRLDPRLPRARRCPPTSSARRTASASARSAATNLNTAGPDHHHDKGPDPRWAALSQIKFEE